MKLLVFTFIVTGIESFHPDQIPGVLLTLNNPVLSTLGADCPSTTCTPTDEICYGGKCIANPCKSESCSGAGTCSAAQSDPSQKNCTCTPGKIGDTCQHDDPCAKTDACPAKQSCTPAKADPTVAECTPITTANPAGANSETTTFSKGTCVSEAGGLIMTLVFSILVKIM